MLEQYSEEFKKTENEYIVDIIRENYTTYAVLFSNNEGKNVSVILIQLIPLLLNKTNISENHILILYNFEESNNYNSSHVIDRLEGNISFENFKALVLKHIDTKELYKNKNLVNTSVNNQRKISSDLKYDDIETNHENLTKADMIEIQKRELEKLEFEELQKKKKIQDEQKEKERQALLAKKKAEEDEKLKNQKLNELPQEPDESDPNTIFIIFRHPHSEKRSQRRFLKSNKVKDLYNFIHTLGKDIFEDSGEFELITPFPFKAYRDLDKTLEEEKLVNAVLQIKEI